MLSRQQLRLVDNGVIKAEGRKEWSHMSDAETNGYLDVQVVSGCEEVFAIRQDYDIVGVLYIDNFLLEKTYEVGDPYSTYRYLGTYCPEDKGLGSSDYKC